MPFVWLNGSFVYEAGASVSVRDAGLLHAAGGHEFTGHAPDDGGLVEHDAIGSPWRNPRTDRDCARHGPSGRLFRRDAEMDPAMLGEIKRMQVLRLEDLPEHLPRYVLRIATDDGDQDYSVSRCGLDQFREFLGEMVELIG